MDQVKTGKFIAQKRKEQNMTQMQLAEKLGVTDRAVSKWENGRGLPDVSLMKPLCKILGITLSELLEGESAEEITEESLTEKSILDALRERQREIVKRELLKKICIAMLMAVLITVGAFKIGIVGMVLSGIRGEGYSVSCYFNTSKAEKSAELIKNGDYEKAVKYIGFKGEKDKIAAAEIWKENMHNLEDEIQIEAFEISEKIILDDYFPMGTYNIVIYDRKTQVEYHFRGNVSVQDRGIVFGGLYLPLADYGSRRTEIGLMIENALLTWNPG